MIVVAAIFFGELAIMIVLQNLALRGSMWVNIADPLSLSIIVFPMVYFGVFRPVLEKNRRLKEVERILLAERADLERRVEDRTAEIAQANVRLAESLTAIRNKQLEISELAELTRLLPACDNLEEAYGVARKQLQRLLPGASGAIYLMNHSRNCMKRVLEWGTGQSFEETFAPQSCWSLRCGRALKARHGQDAVFCTHAEIGQEGQYHCIPLMANGEALGSFFLHDGDRQAPTNRRSSDDETERAEFLNTIAEHLALAISNIQLREALRHQALRDPLTGLFNRRYLLETLQRELDRAASVSSPASVVLFDIDHFKKFNDVHGHDAGDALLVAMGSLLLRWVRPTEIVARYGGEEFIVFLPDVPLAAAIERAEDLRRAVEVLSVVHHGQRLGAITMSAGVAQAPEHGANQSDLVKSADLALYHGKASGRNRVVGASMPPHAEAAAASAAS
ncbi:MAG: diguanylate cyclase [Rhizobiales bacterium]|nr:diguanylate cyclase [Hyphomicrobiales bacterium]